MGTMKAAMQKRPPTSMLAPSKLVALYEEFITSNSSSVSQVESALRSLTYIIPGEVLSQLSIIGLLSPEMLTSWRITGRFRESELATETLHSFVQLLSLYHDSLVSRSIAKLPASISRPSPTPHERYTKYWCKVSPTYRRIALCLQMIRHTELLWEMVARRRGEKIRYRVIIVIEAIKAILQFILLHLTGSRPVVSPPLPEREIDPRAAEAEKEHNEWDVLNSPTTPQEISPQKVKWTMPRTGQTLPSLPQANNVSNYLISKVLTADDIKQPRNLLHRIAGQGQMAEVVYILRPLIYALALKKWSKNKKSWMPWLIGFGLEYNCRQLAKRNFKQSLAGGLRGLTGLERDEMRKRGANMLWWIMRSGFYANITQ
ncbi:Peroxisomal membrane protein pex16 [Ascosphaera aggregata]|nr:Peroxisomal membrane protein pex16 [Ascosphaera aggregata]